MQVRIFSCLQFIKDRVVIHAGQHLCNHAKVTMDAKLAASVPPLKRLLETVVLRVKSMLAQNNSLNAFWIGMCIVTIPRSFHEVLCGSLSAV